MKSSRFLPILAAMLMLVFFASCEKDEINNTVETTIPTATTTTVSSPVAARLATNGAQAQSSSSTGGLQIECISIDFPFDFDVDGVIYTINSVDDLDTLFSSVVTPNTVSLDFVYPLNVTLEDGSGAVVADGNELSVLVSACVPSSGWGTGQFPAFFFDAAPCLSLSYPVMLEDLDGNPVSAVDEPEFINLLAANPNLTFVFPLSVVDSAGTVISVADEQVLFDMLAMCACPGTGSGHGGNPNELSFFLGEGCFDYNYPINLVDFDGNTITVADENEFSVAILNGEFANFEYSFTVTLESDGSQVVINDENDFTDVFMACFGGPTYGVNAFSFISSTLVDSCYDLVYPFDIDVNGTITTITNATEAQAFANGQQIGYVVFPLDVTQAGQLVTLVDAQAYHDMVSACFGPGTGLVTGTLFIAAGLTWSNCYTLVYPFSITNLDGTVSVISDEVEARSYLDAQMEGDVQFPVDVTQVATGATVTLVDEFALFDLLDDCQ